ncbi:hypothetical protein RCL1_004917 [Eukaryota sp. TZLM3-RCL]
MPSHPLSVLILISLYSLSFSNLISSTSIESCIQNSDDNLTCNQKALITFTMPSSSSPEFVFSFDGTPSHPFNERVSIQCTRTQPKIVFPLHYHSHIWPDWKERIVGTSIFQRCFAPLDDSSSSTPTCGFQNINNKVVPFSSGFCCSCDVMSSSLFRSSLACSLVGNSFHSAHCLRPSSDPIPVFRIGNPIVDVTVTCRSSFFKEDHVTVSPVTRVALSLDKKFLVSLEGNLGTFSSHFPNIQDKFLIIYENTPMIISSEILSSFDPNQVHAVFASFSHSSCFQKASSSLIPSIKSLLENDLFLEKNGKKPLYLASSFGNLISFNSNLEFLFNDFYSLFLKIEFSADLLLVIHNSAPVIISELNVEKEIVSGGILSKFSLELFNPSTLNVSVNADFSCKKGEISVAVSPASTLLVTSSINHFDLSFHVGASLIGEEILYCIINLIEVFSGNVLDFRSVNISATSVSNQKRWGDLYYDDTYTDSEIQTCDCNFSDFLCIYFCYFSINFDLSNFLIVVVVSYVFVKTGLLKISFKILWFMIKIFFKCNFQILKFIFCFSKKKKKTPKRLQKSSSQTSLELSELFKTSNMLSSSAAPRVTFLNINNCKKIIDSPPKNGRISIIGTVQEGEHSTVFNLLPGRNFQTHGFKNNSEYLLSKPKKLNKKMFTFEISNDDITTSKYRKIFTDKPLFPLIN